jgi:hypothetical protein
MDFENKTGLQLRSLIKKSGELELSLVKVAIPEPAADEVVVRVESRCPSATRALVLSSTLELPMRPRRYSARPSP